MDFNRGVVTAKRLDTTQTGMTVVPVVKLGIMHMLNTLPSAIGNGESEILEHLLLAVAHGQNVTRC